MRLRRMGCHIQTSGIFVHIELQDIALKILNLEELQSKYEFKCGRFAGDIFEGLRSVKKSVFPALLGHVNGQVVISFFRLLLISEDFLKKG